MVKKNYYILSALSAAISIGIVSVAYAQNATLVGIAFENGGLNKIVHRITRYVGSCSGSNEKNIVGRFRDQSVPTEDDYRVRLTNLSIPDLIDGSPYSDRKYKKDNKSEKIKFKLGDSHSKKKLVLTNGLNNISFVIYSGDFGKDEMTIIKEGEFQIDISQEIIEVPREISWNNAPRFGCLDQNGDFQQLTDIAEIKNCPLPVSQKIGSCEGRTEYGEIKAVTLDDL